jgi:hypothetical protein
MKPVLLLCTRSGGWAAPTTTASDVVGTVHPTSRSLPDFLCKPPVLLLVFTGLALGCSQQESLYNGHPVGHWRQAAKSSNTQERIEAVAALGELKHIDAIPDLTAALKDPDASVRAKAAAALWGFTGQARDAVPDLTAALKDKNVEVRMNAAGALGDIGGDDPAVVLALCESLRDRTPEVRAFAAQSLGRVGRDAPKAVQKLTEGLRDREKTVRIAALYALAEIGPNAAAAFPELKRLAQDKDGDVRTAATYALTRVNTSIPH